MQIHIDFATNRLNLPISYNTILQGFIYHTLEKTSPEYSEYIHNKGQNKPMVFGRLRDNNYRVVGQEIIFPNHASLEIRSQDELFIQNFLLGLKKGEMIKLGHNFVELEDFRLKNTIITKEEISAVTDSPFTFKATYLETQSFDKEFAVQKLIYNAKKKWEYYGKDENDFSLNFNFDDTNPKRIHSVFKNVYIVAWDTSFKISGNIETLNFIYNSGIGSRNAEGFGLFDIV